MESYAAMLWASMIALQYVQFKSITRNLYLICHYVFLSSPIIVAPSHCCYQYLHIFFQNHSLSLIWKFITHSHSYSWYASWIQYFRSYFLFLIDFPSLFIYLQHSFNRWGQWLFRYQECSKRSEQVHHH